MIVACPSCEARYRIDDARVGSGGARLRCARCRSLFRLPGSAVSRAAPASLAAILNQKGPASPPVTASNSDAPQGGATQPVLLLADPDSTRAARFIARLAAMGLGVAHETDGVEALLALQRARYPVAVLSAELPRIKGEDLCEIIKGSENLRTTGVVLLSTERDAAAISRIEPSAVSADLAMDVHDAEARLIPFLASYGLRAKPEVDHEANPRPGQPEISSGSAEGAPELARPKASRTPLSGREAEREKAERLARIVVSDMLLYHPERFDQVLDDEGLLVEFAPEIREGVLLLSKRVDAEVLSERDYLSEELCRAARQRAGA